MTLKLNRDRRLTFYPGSRHESGLNVLARGEDHWSRFVFGTGTKAVRQTGTLATPVP